VRRYDIHFLHTSFMTVHDRTAIASLSLHDALPIYLDLMQEMGMNMYRIQISWSRVNPTGNGEFNDKGIAFYDRLINAMLKREIRSEEHTSELQSRFDLVCRLLLET